jgi:hypothetical protein
VGSISDVADDTERPALDGAPDGWRAGRRDGGATGAGIQCRDAEANTHTNPDASPHLNTSPDATPDADATPDTTPDTNRASNAHSNTNANTYTAHNARFDAAHRSGAHDVIRLASKTNADRQPRPEISRQLRIGITSPQREETRPPWAR